LRRNLFGVVFRDKAAAKVMDLELEDAVARILAAVPAPAGESIPVADVCSRVTMERVLSPGDLPSFDNSSMDGYAVRAEEVAAATPETPVRLRLAGKVAAGEMFRGEVTTGACVRIATGSPLPAGADAVVMQEDTRTVPNASSEVLILDAVKPWENVRLRGEDVRRGAMVAEAGAPLTAGCVSLLAATGITQIKVARQPIVSLLATGSELREPGQPLAPGQIYESNRLGLACLTSSAGGIARPFPLVPDVLEATRLSLTEAFRDADAVVTTGGASVGELDFVKLAFEQAGGQLQFWRVAIKPGRPFVFGRWGQKLLFGLPGNPVSAFVTFLLLVRPALLRWQGIREVGLPSHPGVLAEPVANPGGRRHFLRVKVDVAGNVYSSGLQASHALSSLAAASALLDVPPRSTLAAGSAVRVLRWE
jgi:molybdopterin molybdotransferase